VLQLDDILLPIVRAVAEEFGQMDARGVLKHERKALLTHGDGYFRPGVVSFLVEKYRAQGSYFGMAFTFALVSALFAILLAPYIVVGAAWVYLWAPSCGV
jgi:hypothetical protein